MAWLQQASAATSSWLLRMSRRNLVRAPNKALTLRQCNDFVIAGEHSFADAQRRRIAIERTLHLGLKLRVKQSVDVSRELLFRCCHGDSDEDRSRCEHRNGTHCESRWQQLVSVTRRNLKHEVQEDACRD